jgi:golgi SNAP receptor complex member 1
LKSFKADTCVVSSTLELLQAIDPFRLTFLLEKTFFFEEKRVVSNFARSLAQMQRRVVQQQSDVAIIDMERPTGTFARWEVLRKDARLVETELESKLVAYSKFGSVYSEQRLMTTESNTSTLSSSASASATLLLDRPRETDLESVDLRNENYAREIESLLTRLSDLNAAMSDVVRELGDAGGGATLAPVLMRHHSVLQEYRVEFRKTQAAIEQTREHADLLLSVRQDISRHRSGGGGDGGGGNVSADDTSHFLRERGALHSSQAISDAIIEQALAAKETLNAQRHDLRAAMSRLQGMATAIPGVDTIMRHIKRRRMRDHLILVGVFAFCLCALIYYMFLSGGSDSGGSARSNDDPLE